MQIPECVELEAFRLEHDLTWEELAEAMARKGIIISPRTLHYLTKRAPEDVRPRDTTMYKIRKFLKLIEVDRRRTKARRAARVAVA